MRLVHQLAEYTIALKQLEDSLLARLAASQVRMLAYKTCTCKPASLCYVKSIGPCFSQGDILEDMPLIENLEETKRTAVQIAEQVKQAKVRGVLGGNASIILETRCLMQETEVSISKAREVYRPVALRGALIYYVVDSLSALDRVYHYSMANFIHIMIKGMVRGPVCFGRLQHGNKSSGYVFTHVCFRT